MLNVALIFPGQGSQIVGMGKDFYESSKTAKDIFNKANNIIDGLNDVIFDGPQDKLTQTRFCQPAIVSMSIAALEVFKEHNKSVNINPVFTCGLSLGEYSSLVASETLSFEDTIRLIEKRGAFMDEACKIQKGSMAAVIGMDKASLVEICGEFGVEVANFNSHEQIVITGEYEKIRQVSERIKEAGAKRVIPLDVSGAFHSSLMQSAAEKFKGELEKISFSNAKFPIISNVYAKPVTAAKDISDNLAKQITSSVQWVASIEYIKSQGVDTFIEIGPGNILRGLLRKIDKNLRVFNISKITDIDLIDI